MLTPQGPDRPRPLVRAPQHGAAVPPPGPARTGPLPAPHSRSGNRRTPRPRTGVRQVLTLRRRPAAAAPPPPGCTARPLPPHRAPGRTAPQRSPPAEGRGPTRQQKSASAAYGRRPAAADGAPGSLPAKPDDRLQDSPSRIAAFPRGPRPQPATTRHAGPPARRAGEGAAPARRAGGPGRTEADSGIQTHFRRTGAT